MASTPFDDNDPATEERIRTRAYHLWEAEGQPHGRDADYWERASELVHMEQAGNTGQIAPEDAREPIEEAAIQENLGEFPDRFADQGEKSAAPGAKATSRLRRKPEHTEAASASADDEDAEAPPAAAGQSAEPSSERAKPAAVAKPGAAPGDDEPAVTTPKKAAAPKSKR